MPVYGDWVTSEKVEIKDMKNYKFPFSGANILYKIRLPVAKEVSTD